MVPLGPQEIPTLRFEDLSQTFPVMLLQLVGTADTAGDCEQTRPPPPAGDEHPVYGPMDPHRPMVPIWAN